MPQPASPPVKPAVKPAITPAKPRVKPPRAQPRPKDPDPDPMWHVVLLNDDDHTYDYVIEMLQSIFGYELEKGYKMACEVDEKGRVIVATCHKELAELRQEQIQDYGPDPRLAKSKGSMQAEIMPAA
jgi:ATP-dependent Clp protease adaptor protein ClpS